MRDSTRDDDDDVSAIAYGHKLSASTPGADLNLSMEVRIYVNNSVRLRTSVDKVLLVPGTTMYR